MKSSWQASISFVLRHEGGYVNNPSDPGGETKYGISKASYPDVDIMALSQAGAEAIYAKDYWAPLRADYLPGGIDLAVFDFGVNSGTGRSAKMLQTVLGVKADGGIGPLTIQAAEAQSRADHEALVEELINSQRQFYRGLGKPQFIRGWLNRCDDRLAAALALESAVPIPRPLPAPPEPTFWDRVRSWV